mmetsp:Transcript_49890/g.132538  ORF Transcript_49890/g.132538 Transcript_49890/m.132538 type:complete len:339 (-) Transcript_49890:834-1850(-)
MMSRDGGNKLASKGSSSNPSSSTWRKVFLTERPRFLFSVEDFSTVSPCRAAASVWILSAKRFSKPARVFSGRPSLPIFSQANDNHSLVISWSSGMSISSKHVRTRTSSSFAVKPSRRCAVSVNKARTARLQDGAAGRFLSSNKRARFSTDATRASTSLSMAVKNSVPRPTCTAKKEATRFARDCPEKKLSLCTTQGVAVLKNCTTCSGTTVGDSSGFEPMCPKHFAAANTTEDNSCGLKLSIILPHLGKCANTVSCTALWCDWSLVRAHIRFATCCGCISHDREVPATPTKNSSWKKPIEAKAQSMLVSSCLLKWPSCLSAQHASSVNNLSFRCPAVA